MWKFRLQKERRVAPRRPVIAGERAYVVFFYDKGGSSESALLALERASGAEQWAFRIGHVGNEALVADGTTYWSSFEGSVYALDAQGQQRWKAPGAKAHIGIPVLAGDDRLVFAEFARGSRTTWCLDRNTGATVWRFDHGGHSYAVCYADGRVFHTSVIQSSMDGPPDSSLHCLSATDGRPLWKAKAQEFLFNPIACGDKVFVCSNRMLQVHSTHDGQLLAHAKLEENKTTLRVAEHSTPQRLIVWRDDVEAERHSIRAFAVETVKRLFGGSSVNVTQTWDVAEKRGLCQPPIALPSDQLMYLTRDGVLCVLDAATGTRLSETPLKTKECMFGGITLAGDQLVVAHERDAFSFRLTT